MSRKYPGNDFEKRLIFSRRRNVVIMHRGGVIEIWIWNCIKLLRSSKIRKWSHVRTGKNEGDKAEQEAKQPEHETCKQQLWYERLIVLGCLFIDIQWRQLHTASIAILHHVDDTRRLVGCRRGIIVLPTSDCFLCEHFSHLILSRGCYGVVVKMSRIQWGYSLNIIIIENILSLITHGVPRTTVCDKTETWNIKMLSINQSIIYFNQARAHKTD